MGHAAECHISSVIANTSHADFVFKPDRAIVLDPAELPSMRNVRLRQYPIQMQSYWHHRFIAFRRLPQMESVLIEPPSNFVAVGQHQRPTGPHGPHWEQAFAEPLPLMIGDGI